MNVAEALKFIRTKRKLTQKQMKTKYIDPSAYSRIEGNKRSVRMNDLQDLLKIMSINTSEFFSIVNLDNDLQGMKDLYYYCAYNLDDKTSKRRLVNEYEKLVEKNCKSLKDFAQYIGIKSYFSQFWKEIESINDFDVTEVYKILCEKEYFFQADYILLTNIIPYFTKEQGAMILSNAFPVKDIELRDYETKKFASRVLLNWITTRLYENDFDTAKIFIKIAKNQTEFNYDYSYKLNVQYLSDLLNLLLTGEPDYYDSILSFISILENVGDIVQAKAVREEVKLLTHNRLIGEVITTRNPAYVHR
ncbi:helix-turn-helix transcriptional regulator [Enterococcus sp. BWB1-3]|uniref:helix-turn-helix domain-containing protein n=1 Tax=Enterococcus sp. BWB1-3 TaxID=2787713 RepID=UPI001923BC05|nr:helix-turn-helix transcriptional regulator [Enterococcus sp. BWB1-3]MBL1229059.1 helix-turn-helix transcriptional regulator [Enterococcus sp. BWB1-3]